MGDGLVWECLDFEYFLYAFNENLTFMQDQ